MVLSGESSSQDCVITTLATYQEFKCIKLGSRLPTVPSNPLGKLFNLSVPQLLTWNMGIAIKPTSKGSCEDYIS